MKVQKGFTLIELMIVVVVIAILAGIALPSYREYVLRSNRGLAKAELSTIAARQEQYFVNNKTYGSLAALGYSIDDDIVDLYTISIPVFVPPAMTYTITAATKGNQSDDKCATLTLNESGVKGVTGSGATVAYCW